MEPDDGQMLKFVVTVLFVFKYVCALGRLCVIGYYSIDYT